VKKEFMQVSIGKFTWFSFLATAVLFGLEHNLYLAGICAGILFNLVLYRTRSIFQCVLSHATANLALGIYVLNSGNWHFW
ncbi:MAG: CAAX prenyl protease-related protein, partial [Desulfuromonas sp.]